MELFKQKILALIRLSDVQLQQVIGSFTSMNLKKGKILIGHNTFCKRYYFLETGLLRLVNSCGEKKEATAWVIFEGVFFTEILSMKSKKPSNIRIESLEDSQVYVIDQIKLDALCDQVTIFDRYLRLTWEENLYHLIQMKLLHQFSTAKERYATIINDRNLMQRIPQKYLASILGISPYTLSRLRKEIAD